MPVFGLTGGKLAPIQHLVNSSYRVQYTSENWYLRVYNPERHDSLTVESELLWLEALATSGLPVPRPQRAKTGSFVYEVSNDNSTKNYLVSVSSWLEGEIMPGQARNCQLYAAVGVLLGQLHNQSVAWVPPANFKRPRWDAAGVYGTEGMLGPRTRLAWQNLLDLIASDLEEAKDALIQVENTINQSPNCYGLIHGDPSFGNILFKEDIPALIDFDDCGYGYFVYDLAVVLAGAWGKVGYAENQASLLCGYQQVRNLSDEEIHALPAMMVARTASLILWAAAQSPEHPWIEGQWARLKEYKNKLLDDMSSSFNICYRCRST